MKQLPRTWKRMQQWIKAKRERAATEAIIATILRGWTAEDWQKFYADQDAKARARKLANRQAEENDSRKIY